MIQTATSSKPAPFVPRQLPLDYELAAQFSTTVTAVPKRRKRTVAHAPIRQEIRRKAEPSNVDPPWVRIPAPKRVELVPGAFDLSRKKTHNGVKMYLEDYFFIADAIDDLPMLAHLIVGSSLLDYGGNTRPLSTSLLFMLLRNLDVISPAAVKDFRQCSTRHAQKLAQCLRVINTAFNAEANRTYPQATANAT